MTNLAWWQSSPSPFSIIWYCLYGFIAHKLGLSWKDSAWLTGFTVLTTDFEWVLFSILRWSWYVPTDSILQAFIALARDFAAIILFYILLNKVFGNKLKWSNKVLWFYLLNTIFFIVWFGLAPSIAWTDWTYAIIHDFSLPTIIGSFLLSHVIGRIFVTFILRSWIK